MKKIMFNDKYGLTNAVLRGKKTKTRRIEFDERMQQELAEADAIGYGQGCCQVWRDGKIARQIPSHYKVGEVVAVAQSYGSILDELERLNNCTCMEAWEYDAPKRTDYSELMYAPGFRNKMFVRADLMPHRIRITDVRVERLQDISDEDCIKEGIKEKYEGQRYGIDIYTYSFRKEDFAFNPRRPYAALIDKISGKGTWESNPYVFVYDFELVK